jgi:hypothetical protein
MQSPALLFGKTGCPSTGHSIFGQVLRHTLSPCPVVWLCNDTSLFSFLDALGAYFFFFHIFVFYWIF